MMHNGTAPPGPTWVILLVHAQETPSGMAGSGLSLPLPAGKGGGEGPSTGRSIKPLTLTLSQRERGLGVMAKKVFCFCIRQTLYLWRHQATFLWSFPVPTAFSRSMRALAIDGFGRSLGGVLLATALLGGWTVWFLAARVALYEVTQTARLEVDRAAHAVETPVAGRVIMTRLAVGQEVQAGEVLVELDAEAQRLQREEARVRLAGLAAQLMARRQEVTAEEAAWQGERQAAPVALDEARARHREAEVALRAAEEEAEFYVRLQVRGLAAQLDLVRTRAEVHRRRAALDTLRLAVRRLEGAQRTRERDRLARLESFKREVVQLEGDMATATATIERLGHAIDRRRIRAPVAGRLGAAAPLQIGAVVREGDILGAILPPSALKIVAHFPPPAALGRLQPAQPARLRLTGFPWTQYGSITATVASVAHEPRDGQIRVELSLTPDSTSAIPLQHGLSGTVAVEVERVAPVTLVLRAVGKHLGTLKSTFDTRTSSKAAP
jgi:multidrug resistance efflux pump